MIIRFEDIMSWKKAKILTVEVYKSFENTKDFGFKSQIERAAVSVMNNITKSFERRSNKEFRQFMFISKGSCGELRSMLYLAQDLHKINNEQFDKLYNLSIEKSKLLSGLIKTL